MHISFGTHSFNNMYYTFSISCFQITETTAKNTNLLEVSSAGTCQFDIFK